MLKSYLKKYLLVTVITILFYTLSRIIFLLYNYNYFNDFTVTNFIGGLYIDSSTHFTITILFSFLYFIPLKFRYNKIYQKILYYLYLTICFFSFILNFIDIQYFPFNKKRSTADLFKLIFSGNEDLVSLISQFLKDYWFLVIIFIIFISFFIIIIKKLWFCQKPISNNKFNYSINSFLFITVIFTSVIISRGGFQLRPTDILTASKFGSSSQIPLILNTPFSIIKTFDDKMLDKKSYFSEEEITTFFNSEKNHQKKETTSKNKNVVIILLESFSKSFIGSLSGEKSYTPFLDSLSSHCLYFENSYANGKRSIEALPAVFTSLPTLSNSPFIYSGYSSNRINGLTNILNKNGYDMAFFHGAKNGSMGFDIFTSAAGISKYFGLSEYGGKDYDGTWGVFDEPFLKYSALQINNLKQPFFASIFTLTSHHPYPIPEHLKSKFKKENEEEHSLYKTVRYTDFALKQFFKAIKNEPWYNETIFIILADHVAPNIKTNDNKFELDYSIPILFYTPDSSLSGKKEGLIKQSDIMPILIDSLLNLETEKYISYGSNILKDSLAKNNFIINYSNNSYIFIDNNYYAVFRNNRLQELYNINNDYELKFNIIENKVIQKEKIENVIKSYIQQYNNRFINNELTIE